MSFTARFRQPLNKRLLPLYIAAFFQGFVFWYAIEKLFMTSIGFDYASIGIMIAAYLAIMLIVETPAGILADRWSRKGVLIVASVLLALSAVVGGLSNSIPVFIFSSMLWGAFYALYTGTYDSIVYDTLLEEKGNADEYDAYYGNVRIVDGLALVTSALIGGVIGEYIGLHEVFLWSAPFALVAIGALLMFKEPTLHQAAENTSLKDHIRTTLQAVTKRRMLWPLLIALIGASMVSEAMYELYQLWYLSLNVSPAFFGPASAALLVTFGIGGFVARFLKLFNYRVLYALLGVAVMCALGFVFLRDAVAIVICQVILGGVLMGLGVVLSHFLHNSLSSNIRAGASSAVSTLCRIIFIPFSLLFGFVSQTTTIFDASWLIVGALIITCAFVMKALATKQLDISQTA